MNKYKSIIAVIAALVLVCSLIACTQKAPTESVTQAVTDENGELITEEIEAQVVTDQNGAPVTEVVTDGQGKPVTTVKDGQYQNVTQVVTQRTGGSPTAPTTGKSSGGSKTTTTKKKKSNTTTKKGSKTTTKKTPTKKPEAPSTPSGLTAKNVTVNSATLSWKNVSCSGYEAEISQDGQTYTSVSNNLTNNSVKVEKLISNTEYKFRVRAFNTNSAGTSVSEWAYGDFKTKLNTESHYITFKIKLPLSGNQDDVLVIKVNDDTYEENVKLDGSTYTFKTTKKYKAADKKNLIKYSISLKNNQSSFSGETDKTQVAVDISGGEINILDGEDDE